MTGGCFRAAVLDGARGVLLGSGTGDALGAGHGFGSAPLGSDGPGHDRRRAGRVRAAGVDRRRVRWHEGGVMTVGTAKDAARALPGGGELVGEGEFRVVPRIGSVVYKVGRTREEQALYSDDMHLWADDYEPNRFELDVASRARPLLPPVLAVPEIARYVLEGRTFMRCLMWLFPDEGVALWVRRRVVERVGVEASRRWKFSRSPSGRPRRARRYPAGRLRPPRPDHLRPARPARPRSRWTATRA